MCLSRSTSRRAAVLSVAACFLLTVACAKDAEVTSGPDQGTQQGNTNGPSPDSPDGGGPDGSAAPAARVDTYPGMPPVVNPANIYSEAGAGNPNPATKDAIFRVYVPNEASGTLTVIDPTTMKVIDTFQAGTIPQHVVPSYDMSTLYLLNNSSNSIMPIDPLTGQLGKAIYVDDPYNLYFTPDGKEAIVVAEAEQRFDFADPKTFKVNTSLQASCEGLNHLDYSIDGKYFIATCEFDGRLIKVDLATRQVVGTLQIDITKSGKKDPIKKIAQPQDVRVANDGKVFYVADLITNGVYVIDGESFTQTGFIPMGVGTHGLYPSRDGTKLYVVNRGTSTIPPVGSFKGKGQGSVMVLDFATQQVIATWDAPGASPDMGNLTADGKQLWLGGRYDGEVYVFDTEQGKLINRIKAGQNPHGLTVWPQPGRFSFGHTGNMR